MIDIKPEDLSISEYSSKPTSPWINKPKNGIKIVHGPSGVFTTSESARSQHQNKALAMEELHFKLKGWEGVTEGVKRSDVQADGIAERELASKSLDFSDKEQRTEKAPTDSGIPWLDGICGQYNDGKIDISQLVCTVWNKGYYEGGK